MTKLGGIGDIMADIKANPKTRTKKESLRQCAEDRAGEVKNMVKKTKAVGAAKAIEMIEGIRVANGLSESDMEIARLRANEYEAKGVTYMSETTLTIALPKETYLEALEKGAVSVVDGELRLDCGGRWSLADVQNAEGAVLRAIIRMNERIAETKRVEALRAEQEAAETARHDAAEKRYMEMADELANAEFPDDYKIIVENDYYEPYFLACRGYIHSSTMLYIGGNGRMKTLGDAIAAIEADLMAVEAKKAEEKRKAEYAAARPERYKAKAAEWAARALEAQKAGLVKQVEAANARSEFCLRCSAVPASVEIEKKENVYCAPIEEYHKRIPLDVNIVKPPWADRLEVWTDEDDPYLIGVVEVVDGGREFFLIAQWT